MFKTLDRYEENGLGLPYPIVLIDSAEAEIDDETGETVGVSIPDLEHLVYSVALVRALIPIQLSGKEVRFIREALGMTSKALAEEIEVDKATFSRWENDKVGVGAWADKQVRQIAVIKLGPLVPCLSLDATAVVGMQILPKPAADAWPHIEMRRVLTQDAAHCGPSPEAWDTVEFAMAA